MALAFAGGCGKSDEQNAAEKAAEETREAAEAPAKAAEQAGPAAATDGMAAAAKAIEGFAGALPGRHDRARRQTVEPVSFRDLQTALPDVAGWEREQPTGERMTMPGAVLTGRGHVHDRRRPGPGQDRRLGVQPVPDRAVVDVPGDRLREGIVDGYEKSINVSGNPGFERWNSESKDGELNLVVAKRFLVTVEGNNIGDTKVLQEFAAKVDTAKLAR